MPWGLRLQSSHAVAGTGSCMHCVLHALCLAFLCAVLSVVSPAPPPNPTLCPQEKLALVITPSFMGPLSCSAVHFGSLPPLLRALRVVNLNMPGKEKEARNRRPRSRNRRAKHFMSHKH